MDMWANRPLRSESAGDGANRLERHSEFEASEPDQKWVADFIYIWTAEGWLYAAALVDLYSRRIVGRSMSDTTQARMASDALLMALCAVSSPLR